VGIVRIIVDDVDEAAAFYREHLGFELEDQWGHAIAILARGDLSLWVSGPLSSAARPMPDGMTPQAGGWNRVVIEVEDIESRVEALRAAGVRFRNDVIGGPGGRQIILDDPSGNPVELFEPAR